MLHISGAFEFSRAVKSLAEEKFYRALGGRIRELRGAMSQERLAKEVGLTRTSIVNIEAGKQKLLLHNLFRIAEALAVRPSDLLSSLEPQSPQMPRVVVDENVSNHINRWIMRSINKAAQTKLAV